MKDILIENEIYTLRKPKDQDVKALFELTQDPQVMLYYGSGAMTDIKQAENEINWFKGLFNNNCGRWVIADSGTDTYIGDIGFFNYHKQHKRVEVGFKLNKKYWGKGIMSSCLKSVLQVGFKELGYNRVEALIDERNTSSYKLVEKNGFVKEGLLREYEFEFGKYVNLTMYSILKSDHVKTIVVH